MKSSTVVVCSNCSQNETHLAANTITGIILKFKKIFTFFHHSAKLTNALKIELKSRNLAITSVIQSVDTGWNSIYFMLQRLYTILDPINIVLFRQQNILELFTLDEVADLEDLLKLLKPIAEVTNDLNCEKYCTVSLIIHLQKVFSKH